MAEATTTINVTPKQLGKHLRSIRRKKGLSLSEVARGAGLSRRELVAYERGKVPIPESDLWVLAGSCGVDVAELMPSTPSLELTAAANATSVGDTRQPAAPRPGGRRRHRRTSTPCRSSRPSPRASASR